MSTTQTESTSSTIRNEILNPDPKKMEELFEFARNLMRYRELHGLPLLHYSPEEEKSETQSI